MEKVTAGIFDGLQIRQIMKGTNFVGYMSERERKAWTSFVKLAENLLGNKKYVSDHYQFLV